MRPPARLAPLVHSLDGLRTVRAVPQCRRQFRQINDCLRREPSNRLPINARRAFVGDLNPVLRGWFGYFKQAHYTTFSDIDGFIRRRLRSMLLKQKKCTHIGYGTLIHKTWPNAYFRGCRVVRSQSSLGQSETVSMKKPPTGEPYAGKPPVRFGGRGGASHPDP